MDNFPINECMYNASSVHEVNLYKLTLMAASKCPSVRPSITPAVVPARLRRQGHGMNTLTRRGKYDAKVSLTIN